MIRRHYPAWLRRRRHGSADEATLTELSAAVVAHDEEAVRALLHRSVTLVVDSGGRIPTASGPITGQTAAASELVALVAPGTTAAMTSINGVPGFVFVHDARVVGAVTAEMRSGALVSVWVVCNPDKLRHWNR